MTGEKLVANGEFVRFAAPWDFEIGLATVPRCVRSS